MAFSYIRPIVPFCRLFLQEKQNLYRQLAKTKTSSHLFTKPLLKLEGKFKLKNNFQLKNEINFYDEEIILGKTEKQEEVNHQFQRNHLQNRLKQLTYIANTEIQDRITYSELKSVGGYMVSVFDGHSGSLVADYAANRISSLIDEFVQKNMNKYDSNRDQLMVECLKFAYSSLQKDFYEDVYDEQLKLRNRKIKKMGTCALTLIILDNKVYVANCGDSQAIAVSNYMGNIEFTKLNTRLSVNNPQERQRLKAQFPQQEDIIIEEGKGCYYLKGRLQPTKSIGDYHLKKAECWQGKGKFNGPYLNSQPQITIFPLKQEHKSIVIASDGIWDFIDKWTVSRLSLEENPHEKIFQQTMKKIAELHKKPQEFIQNLVPGERRNYHDDISLGVIDLQNQVVKE